MYTYRPYSIIIYNTSLSVLEKEAMESSSSSIYCSEYQQAKKSVKHSNSPHSARKSQLKPPKKPVAPLPSAPPKVFQVHPINFRDLVQQLTGATADSPPHGSSSARYS